MFEAAQAEQYDRHVGRYNAELARALISFAGVRRGQRALDVGSGPGALARELVALLEASNVAAVDPSSSFAAVARERLPGTDVQVATAEQLPFADNTFDHAFAQLVVNFMSDAHKGVSEMARVTRTGGRVTVATWDYREGMTLLRRFFDAAHVVDPAGADVHDEGLTMRYCSTEELRALFEDAGLIDIQLGQAEPRARYANFEDLWRPFNAGIGPSGAYLLSLDPAQQAALKPEFHRLLGVGDQPFELAARAWLASGEVR